MKFHMNSKWPNEHWTVVPAFQELLCTETFAAFTKKVILSLARIFGFQSVDQLLWELYKTLCSQII